MADAGRVASPESTPAPKPMSAIEPTPDANQPESPSRTAVKSYAAPKSTPETTHTETARRQPELPSIESGLDQQPRANSATETGRNITIAG